MNLLSPAAAGFGWILTVKCCKSSRIEGLMAELDAADEYHISKESSTLYLFYNTSADGSAGPGAEVPP